MSNNVQVSGGVSFLGLLQIVFIVLRLVGTIDWSWWWVLAPTWGPIALILGILLLAVGFMVIFDTINRFKRY